MKILNMLKRTSDVTEFNYIIIHALLRMQTARYLKMWKSLESDQSFSRALLHSSYDYLQEKLSITGKEKTPNLFSATCN